MPVFIKTELKSDSDSDLEKMEAKIDNKLEPDSDNDSVYDTMHWFFWMIINKCDSHKLLSIKVIVINDRGWEWL